MSRSLRWLPAFCAVSLGLTLVGPASASAAGPARVLVVSPFGSDANQGTSASPLRTIQIAVHRLADGGVVELRGGTYGQRVRLVSVHDVTIRPFGTEHPVLDGSALTPGTGLTAMVEIADSAGVTVRGLEVTGYRTVKLNVTPAGFYVHGHAATVRIEGNHVHDMGNYNKTLGSFDLNAHGIAAYGDDPHASISDLSIIGNEVDHLHLGASESVVVNGNVDGWTIAGNRIHDDNNIGIDAIGFEPTLTGAYRYTTLNRARNGLIADNVVARIQSRGNPAYWEGSVGGVAQWCNCADGIYVDGGTHITIAGNRVTDSDIGIEVAAENARGSADHVLVDRNRVTGSLYVGIATGGYCNGASDCGGVRTGTSHDNVFANNWLRGNNRLNDGSPEILIQYYTSNDVFTRNTVIATNSAHTVYGTVPGGRASENVSNCNDFQAVGGSAAVAEFGWSGKSYSSFAAYRRATGQDAASTFSDPG
jgi:hypothetical protein